MFSDLPASPTGHNLACRTSGRDMNAPDQVLHDVNRPGFVGDFESEKPKS